VDELGPLNSCLYDYLTTKPWLLRGSPNEERMRKVCVNRFQTSVDLVSATDGLRHDVAREILKGLFSGSVSVPRSVRRLAERSLEPLVGLASLGVTSDKKAAKRVTHGQMMGAYLSFPLLCLQSYLAARWAARDCPEATFLVNGDDAVISANREILDRDYPDFFSLNEKKTIRAENVVEVNSTVFLREGGKWHEVRHLRRGTLLPGYSGALHLAKACSATPQWSEAYVKARLSRRWGFLPSQLGLHAASRCAWRRELSMLKRRLFTELPLPLSQRDPEISLGRGLVLDPDEKEALTDHVFSHGRCVNSRETYSPSIGAVRRSYRYRKLRLFSVLSYGSWRKGQLSVPVVSTPFLAEYENDRYKGSLLALSAFRSRLGFD